MSGLTGAGLMLRAALAATRYRRMRAAQVAEADTEGDEGERTLDGGSGEAAGGEPSGAGGASAESGPDRPNERKEQADGGERSTEHADPPADGEHHVT
jgi:hypothetical protein